MGIPDQERRNKDAFETQLINKYPNMKRSSQIKSGTFKLQRLAQYT